MRNIVRRIGRFFIKTAGVILSPPLCWSCKEHLSVRTPLCEACCAKIQPVVSRYIKLTSTISLPVYALGAYEEPLRSMVLTKHTQSSLGAHYLARLMIAAGYSYPVDVLVPMPIHWRRWWVRGFNQAEILAEECGRAWNIPVCAAVKRCRATAYQTGLSTVLRAENVRAAFVLTSMASQLAGKHVVIIDDVMTTGVTLEAVAKEILKSNPASIAAFVACQTT